MENYLPEWFQIPIGSTIVYLSKTFKLKYNFVIHDCCGGVDKNRHAYIDCHVTNRAYLMFKAPFRNRHILMKIE